MGSCFATPDISTRARVCALTLDEGQPVIWSCDEAGKSLEKPRAATKYEAVQLVLCGVIRWGVFLRWDPKRFLRRLERAGARVVPVRMGLVRRYRFEAGPGLPAREGLPKGCEAPTSWADPDQA